MKIIKHSILVLFFTTITAFSQKQTKEINESFTVNANVIVEIDTRQSDVKVEIWNKNEVSIKGVWEVDGMSKEMFKEYFDNWDFEALGNKNKVVITSKSTESSYDIVFGDMDFDFNFDVEPYVHVGEIMANVNTKKVMPPMPPMPPIPAFPAPVVEYLAQIEFDHDAYQKDKEAYMKEFEERQKEWEEKFEKQFEPQMKEYEKKMEEWEKEFEPQMKEYEKQMEVWEKEMEPKMKEYEIQMEAHGKKLEKKMEKMEKEIEIKYAQKMIEKGEDFSKKFNIKKSLIIRVPKGAKLKVNAHDGNIVIPDALQRI